MYEMRISGKGFENMILELQKIGNQTEQDMFDLATQSANYMKSIIETSRKRDREPTDKPHLPDLIEAEQALVTPIDYVVGVGNLDTIESLHGHGYKLLNWGGLPAGGKFVPGQFTDGKAKKGGGRARFLYEKGSQYGMTPKKPVEGINFIEKTLNWALSALQGILLRRI